jgi:hypothetical protein
LGIDGFLLTVHTFASTALGRRFYYASIYAFSRSSLTFIYYLHTSIVVGVLWQLDWAIQEIQFISGIRHVYERVIYVHCFVVSRLCLNSCRTKPCTSNPTLPFPIP